MSSCAVPRLGHARSRKLGSEDFSPPAPAAYDFSDHTALGFMAHTNHYVAPKMSPYEGAAHDESVVRLSTAERQMREGMDRGDDPVELVARVLRGHDPTAKEAICGHPDENEPPAEQGMTVGSMICDLDERRLYACAGPPCENPYEVFEMGGT
jgi:hypothetical protein